MYALCLSLSLKSSSFFFFLKSVTELLLYVTQASLKLSILLPQTPECQDYTWAPPHLFSVKQSALCQTHLLSFAAPLNCHVQSYNSSKAGNLGGRALDLARQEGEIYPSMQEEMP